MPALSLTNPPIAEAVFEIQVEVPGTLHLAELEGSLTGLLTAAYPKKRKVFAQSHTIELNSEAVSIPSVSQRFRGLQFWTTDEKQVLQFLDDRFTFNRLAPYTSFTDYIEEVRKGWEIFSALLKPVVVRQITLRYINQFTIPTQGRKINLDEYFVHGPHYPDEDDMTLATFNQRQVFVDNKTGMSGGLTLMAPPIVPSPDGQVPPSANFIFDIDTSISDLNLSPSSPEIWGKFTELRAFKNRLFECSLTQQCLALFH